MTTNDFALQLTAGLEQFNLAVTDSQQTSLLAYLYLLQKWNQAYNLTAIRNSGDMVSQLLLDALVAIPWLRQSPVLDVGTGAGLPGIPLAITNPDISFTLLDSNGKKIRFIKQVVIELQISNVDVVQSRVEAFQPDECFAMVISRAYADMAMLVTSTSHLLTENGEWLAWKGELVDAELTAVRQHAQVEEVIPVQLPGVTGARHLVRLKHLAG